MSSTSVRMFTARRSTTLMREQHARREFTSLPVMLTLVLAVLGANDGAGAAPTGVRVQAPSASLAYDMVSVMRAAGSLR